MTVTDTSPVVPASTAPLVSIVYSSRATVPFRDAQLATLLAESRMRNESRGLTGLLLSRDDRFMQVLEGPEPSVRELLRIIGREGRHTDVQVLDTEPIAERRFASWSMAYRSMTAAEADEWFGSADAQAAPAAGSRAAELLERFRSA